MQWPLRPRPPPSGRAARPAGLDPRARPGRRADREHVAARRETAEIIAPAIGNLPVIEDEEVCEIHPGEADGLAYDDYIAKYGWRATWRPIPTSSCRRAGRASRRFTTRVGAALTRIAEAHPERTVVIACHGGVVDVGLRTLLGLGMVGGVRPVHREHVADRVRARPGDRTSTPAAVAARSLQRRRASRRHPLNRQVSSALRSSSRRGGRARGDRALPAP